MYERMLDKSKVPTIDQIREYIGEESYNILYKLEKELNNNYDIVRELKFPFGNSYGWGYKYSHKTKHLCYVFFEKGSITVTIQIGNNKVRKLDECFNNFLPRTKDIWQKRYPCGNGGWIHYRVFNEKELLDIIKLINIKEEPKR